MRDRCPKCNKQVRMTRADDGYLVFESHDVPDRERDMMVTCEGSNHTVSGRDSHSY